MTQREFADNEMVYFDESTWYGDRCWYVMVVGYNEEKNLYIVEVGDGTQMTARPNQLSR